ncbi:vacuolar protein sorting-associated protein 9a [Ceratobasidium sp. AG-Ba]|nr:vacuolar protein sorting-associated protein 9a [Ceratobasidium sp. AG-Ba]
MDDQPGPGDKSNIPAAAAASTSTVVPQADVPKRESVVEGSEQTSAVTDSKLESTRGSAANGEPPRLAVVTDIQIPQNFNFPTSPPATSSAKPRFNTDVLDEFDPLVTSSTKKSPVVAPKPIPTPKSTTQELPPTSAPATVATFPSITSLARSFISRPSSPASATRPDLPSPKRASSALPPQSPATRTKPTHASGLSTSSASAAAPVPAPASPNPPPDPEQFDFPRFLEQLKSRPADPVAKYLRSFLHNFAKKTFTVNDQIKLVHDFLTFISARMRECDIWKKNTEVEFDNAVEGMEKLVMNRLYEFTFSPQIARSGKPVTTDDLERDRVLKQRISLFGWIRPEHLDIPMKLPESGEPAEEKMSPASAERAADSEISMGFLMFAQQEMNKIDHYKAPRDKLICILNSCKVIFGLIRHLQGDGGADSFIPLLIFVLIRANPEHLLSNIEYINRFRRASKLQSESGYYLSSLMGAVSFIETMDHSSLSNITQQEFEANVEQAILALPPSPDPTSPPATAPFVSSRSTGSDLSQFASASSSSSVGEESARTLQLPQVAAIAEDTRKFLERTGESLSKPLNAIGRIFSEVLDDEPSSPGRGYPGTSGQVPYRVRQSQPGTPREQPGLLPPLQFPNLGLSTSFPTTPDSGRTPPRPGSPLDFSAMQAEIDRAHAAAADAARHTLQQIFPTMDREVTDMVLEANNGDLGLSIDKLLEMSVAES